MSRMRCGLVLAAGFTLLAGHQPPSPLRSAPARPTATPGKDASPTRLPADAWVALDLKAGARAPDVKVQLRRKPSR
jgi:hypothetical protein